jgi:hypothetical protein
VCIEPFDGLIEQITPTDVASTDLAGDILAFQDHCESTAHPFEWKLTRADLDAPLASTHPASLAGGLGDTPSRVRAGAPAAGLGP